MKQKNIDVCIDMAREGLSQLGEMAGEYQGCFEELVVELRRLQEVEKEVKNEKMKKADGTAHDSGVENDPYYFKVLDICRDKLGRDIFGLIGKQYNIFRDDLDLNDLSVFYAKLKECFDSDSGALLVYSQYRIDNGTIDTLAFATWGVDVTEEQAYDNTFTPERAGKYNLMFEFGHCKLDRAAIDYLHSLIDRHGFLVGVNISNYILGRNDFRKFEYDIFDGIDWYEPESEG